MKRWLFVFWLVILLVAMVACRPDRDDSEPADSVTGTLAAPMPVPTVSGRAIPAATAPSPASPGITLPEVNLPDVELPDGALATAQAALQEAGETAGTAVQQAGTAVQQAGTAVQQAGDAAGTAVVVATEQGGAALATVRALPTPDVAQLTERLAAARPDENGNLSVMLNESEVNQLLQLRYLVLSAEPELTDATVRFQSGVIVLSGNVPLLLPVSVTLSLRPVVGDGQFDLEILDASLGRLQAPELVLGFASDLVSNVLDDILRRLPEGFELQSITVEEGQLTISGRLID
jgi:hypothetical protein